jgi:hypothetical protein
MFHEPASVFFGNAKQRSADKVHHNNNNWKLETLKKPQGPKYKRRNTRKKVSVVVSFLGQGLAEQ